MYCISCGKNLPDDCVFCDGCGTPVKREVPATEETDILQKPDGGEEVNSFVNESVDCNCSFTNEAELYPQSVISPEESKKGRKKKNKKKHPWIRLIIVILVLFLAFHTAKAIVFFIDCGDYIFLNEAECGMRDKDALIDSYIEGILNNDDGEIYKLSTIPMELKSEDIPEEVEDATWTDKIKVVKILTMTQMQGYNVTEYLEAENFKTIYKITDIEELDADDYNVDLGPDIKKSDIEKYERYTIEVTCKGTDGKEVGIEMYLGLVRISRTWYVSNCNSYVRKGGF